MKDGNEIYKFIEKLAKKYGFKRGKIPFGRLLLGGIFELRVSNGNTVRSYDTEFEFEISNIKKRPITQCWGGYISSIKLKHSSNDKIIYPTVENWLCNVLQSEEIKFEMRGIKIQRLKNIYNNKDNAHS